MKSAGVLFAVIVVFIAAKARSQPSYNYAKFDFGFAGAVVKPFADEKFNAVSPAIIVGLTYNYTPYVNYIASLQIGAALGRSDGYSEYDTRYTAPCLRIQLQAGEFINYEQTIINHVLKNLYISMGAGLLYHITQKKQTVFTPNNGSSTIQNNTDIYYNMFVPAIIGYEIKLMNSQQEPFMKVDIAYQYNYILGDNFDGTIAGKHNDVLHQLSIGVKLAISGSSYYRKPIR